MARKDLFTKILKKGAAKGVPPGRTQSARDWYREAAGKVMIFSKSYFFNESKDRHNRRPKVGEMYMFYYDPKHKDTLPYYDKFPLVFPIEYYDDGFLGINLHYLPPALRAQLMDGLYEFITDDKYNENTKLRLSYKLLSAATRTSYFRPCVKRYLYTHVRSAFMKIDSTEWDIGLFLPTEQFKKANKAKVWQDSKFKLQGFKV